MPSKVIDTAYDGSTVEVRLGRHLLPMLSISYGDSLDKDVKKRLGSQAQDAFTPGEYKTDDTKCKMESAVFRQLVALLPRRGFGNHRFPIHVSEQHEEIGAQHDTLIDNYIVGIAKALEASNKATEVEFTVKTRQIYWNGRTINRIAGDPNSGTMRL